MATSESGLPEAAFHGLSDTGTALLPVLRLQNPRLLRFYPVKRLSEAAIHKLRVHLLMQPDTDFPELPGNPV